MKNKKTDRRSERTRRLLGDAFVSLMLERRYDTITIQDILDHADIGRSTFYEHYWDKEDLLTSEIERVIDLFSQQTDALDPTLLIPSLALFKHVQEHHRLYIALLRGRGIEVATQTFQHQLRARVETRLRAVCKENTDDLLIGATASYIAGAFITLLQWWIETEMVWSPDRLDALFHDLILPGVHCVLPQESMNGQ